MDDEFMEAMANIAPLALMALNMHRALMESGSTPDEAREVLQAMLAAFMANANLANMQMPKPDPEEED